MNKGTKAFKVGDKVRINFPGGTGNGEVGEIVPLKGEDRTDSFGRYHVFSCKLGSLYYEPRYLEMVEAFSREIKFKDIKKGDLIKCTRTYGDEGEVAITIRVFDEHEDYRTEMYWRSEDQTLILNQSYKKADSVKYELLDRPKTKLPTKSGSIIKVTKARGVECDTIAMLDGEGDWNSAEEVLGYSYLPKAEIQEWTLMKAVPQEV